MQARLRPAVAGLLAGGIGLGLSELLAGLVPGAPSLVTAVGSLLIELQPAGAKQLVVDWFGTADKLVLNLAVLVGALLLSGLLGYLGRRDHRIAIGGATAIALAAALASVRDPLVQPLLALISAAVAATASAWTYTYLSGRRRGEEPPAAETLDFGRRHFLGSAIGVGALALVAGGVGRALLERQQVEDAPLRAGLPIPTTPAGPLPADSLAAIDGLSPLVVPAPDFYRIDTELLVPRLDATSWALTINGMVDHELRFTYDELLDMPLVERYVTIACVSNEVGGSLVGNAKWTGVHLRDLLDQAGVGSGATQVVGRSFNGWTAGFPTAWLDGPGEGAMVAVGMNGQVLKPDHGFPARLIVPGLYGYVSATKWLTNIELTTLEAFDAYWIPLGWSKLGPILLQSRIDVPHGSVSAGMVPVAGVAWAPTRGISKVEVQVDDGPWIAAGLGPAISDETWVQWVYRWPAQPGAHRLTVRATDAHGVVQEERITRPPPDGARGYHTVTVNVT